MQDSPHAPEDLIDVDAVVAAYYDLTPDPSNPDQRVVFGTSGHRGSSLDGAFNDAHIAATTQAICEYRAAQGYTGPLFLGKDTHALSGPAWETAVEVLVANGVDVRVDSGGRFTPTPAVSHAILTANASGGAGGGRHRGHAVPQPAPRRRLQVQPSARRPGRHATPPASSRSAPTTCSRPGCTGVLGSGARQAAGDLTPYDFMTAYVDDLAAVLDLDAIRAAGVRIGADPMGGASVDYWGAIAERHRLDLTVVNPEVDPTWRFMTLDTDGKIRMDCSSPNAMASLIAARDRFDISTGNDADADRHGVVTPDAGLMNPNHYLAVAIGYLFGHRPAGRSGAADRQDPGELLDDRPGGRRAGPDPAGGARRLQVVRAGPARRLGRLRR